MPPKNIKVEISARTIVFTVIFLLLLQFLWLVKDLIFSLFIAFIIMSAVKPAVSFLEKKRIPRSVSAVVVFLFLLFVIGYTLFGLIPPLIIETSALIKSLPGIIEKLDPRIASSLNLNALTQYIPNLTNQLFSIVGSFFSNIVFIFTTLFFSLYFIIDENILKNILVKFFEEEKTERVVAIVDQIESRMSRWFWGEVALMFTVGLLTFIGLSLIGLKYAPPLALVAGLLEVVPNIGPVVSAIPALLIALSQSSFLFLPTIALYFVVQQLENNLIVPFVMRKAVNLHPIVTLMALVVGGKIGGVMGVLLAIPATLFIETVLIEITRDRRKLL